MSVADLQREIISMVQSSDDVDFIKQIYDVVRILWLKGGSA